MAIALRKPLKQGKGQNMRTTYNNGDEVTLVENGCDGCDVTTINGIICHETGCPEAWRDELIECEWCGHEFYPSEAGTRFCCEDCAESYSY